MDLLVFKPSTSDVKASQIGRVPSMEERGENPTQKDTLKHDIVTGMGSLSLALSLGRYCLSNGCSDVRITYKLISKTFLKKNKGTLLLKNVKYICTTQET